jgi:hypothetical protein
MAMMAMTTNSSMSVKAPFRFIRLELTASAFGEKEIFAASSRRLASTDTWPFFARLNTKNVVCFPGIR